MGAPLNNQNQLPRWHSPSNDYRSPSSGYISDSSQQISKSDWKFSSPSNQNNTRTFEVKKIEVMNQEEYDALRDSVMQDLSELDRLEKKKVKVMQKKEYYAAAAAEDDRRMKEADRKMNEADRKMKVADRKMKVAEKEERNAIQDAAILIGETSNQLAEMQKKLDEILRKAENAKNCGNESSEREPFQMPCDTPPDSPQKPGEVRSSEEKKDPRRLSPANKRVLPDQNSQCSSSNKENLIAHSIKIPNNQKKKKKECVVQ